VASVARPVPAYHRIGRSALEQRALRHPRPTGAFESPAAVTGRYSLRRLEPGREVIRSDVGPRIAAGRLRNTAVVELGSHAAVFPAILHLGDQVDVLARPKRPSRAGAFEIDDALVLDATARGVVLAVPAAREAALAGAVASGVVVVTRHER
jgi:hypothetical protein